MPLKSDAIIALDSSVTVVEEDENGVVTAYDSSNNVVSYNEASVATKLTELTNEFNLDELRLERNSMLADTDYWDASDTSAMSQAQIDYRQALRDITNTYTSLDDVVWPTKP